MKIQLITPAKKYSKNGNRTSALRWAKFLRNQGHWVDIETQYNGAACELLIALHAKHAANAVNLYRSFYPQGPLIVALGGTDVNTFLDTDREITLNCMEQADALVCLHSKICDRLPSHLHSKLHFIRQSAMPLASARKPSKRNFDICMVGHLRTEKDPLRAAMALRLLPESSRIRLFHLGKAHDKKWAQAASREQKENHRYNWLGEVPSWRVRREYIKTNLMVLTSTQEGGANVLSEAIAANVPIIASDIPGNTGLLGSDYPGLFKKCDEHHLANLLQQAESDPVFLKCLERACHMLRPKFLPDCESKKWNELVKSVISQVQVCH